MADCRRTEARGVRTNRERTGGARSRISQPDPRIGGVIDEKFGAIPVVDEAEGLVGIVSYVDVLRCFLDRLEEE